MRCEEACHWFKPSWIIWASSLDQVKEKEAHGNNLVQELVINVKFNKVIHHDFTSDTRFNKRYIIVSLQVIDMVIQVVFIQVDLVQQWWFHKWSSTLSYQFKSRKLSSSRRAQDSSRLTKLFDIGGGAPLQSIKVKDPTSILHVAFQGDLHASTCCCYKWCQFQSNWKCP